MNNKTTYQFQTLEAGVSPSPKHENFMDAWKDMYKYVKGLIDADNLSIQLLETTVWIEIANLVGESSWSFYDCRNRAISKGWKKA